jgi:hypothetical protein
MTRKTRQIKVFRKTATKPNQYKSFFCGLIVAKIREMEKKRKKKPRKKPKPKQDKPFRRPRGAPVAFRVARLFLEKLPRKRKVTALAIDDLRRNKKEPPGCDPWRLSSFLFSHLTEQTKKLFNIYIYYSILAFFDAPILLKGAFYCGKYEYKQ